MCSKMILLLWFIYYFFFNQSHYCTFLIDNNIRNSPRFRTQGVKREATTETEDNHLLAPIIKPIHLNLPRTPGTEGGGQVK